MDIQTEKNSQSAYRLAKVSLILGIISILSLAGSWLWNLSYGGGLELMLMALLGLPGLIVGIKALREMTGEKRGKGFAIIGIVLGAPVFLSALLLLIFVLFFMD